MDEPRPSGSGLDQRDAPPDAPPAGESAGLSKRADAKRHARDEFEKWALTYDRSWLNEFVFFPSIRTCQAEIAAWRNSCASAETPFRALDVGCGTGRLLSILARDPCAERLVGVDFSRNMVAGLAEKAAEFDSTGRIHALLGDAERLPLADGSMDVVTCCNSFHHYPHQAQAVREFHRVLRPGGLAVLIDGFRDNVIGWVVFDVAVAWAEKQVHHASWSQVRGMFAAAGFGAIEQRKMNVLAPLLVTTGRKCQDR